MPLVLLDSVHFKILAPGAKLRNRVTGSGYTFERITHTEAEGSFVIVKTRAGDQLALRISSLLNVVLREAGEPIIEKRPTDFPAYTTDELRAMAGRPQWYSSHDITAIKAEIARREADRAAELAVMQSEPDNGDRFV